MSVETRAEVVDGRWRRDDGEDVSWDADDQDKSLRMSGNEEIYVL